MFLYESLKDYEKDMIDREIEQALKAHMTNSRDFKRSGGQFVLMVSELALHNKTIENLIGHDSSDCFDFKVSVVRCRALFLLNDRKYRVSL